MSNLFFLPFRPAISSNGLVIPGAELLFYASGTSTPQAVYADEDLEVSLGTSVEANAAGRFPTIYIDDALEYRVVLKDALGQTLMESDPYIPGQAGDVTPEALQAVEDAEAQATLSRLYAVSNTNAAIPGAVSTADRGALYNANLARAYAVSDTNGSIPGAVRTADRGAKYWSDLAADYSSKPKGDPGGNVAEVGLWADLIAGSSGTVIPLGARGFRTTGDQINGKGMALYVRNDSLVDDAYVTANPYSSIRLPDEEGVVHGYVLQDFGRTPSMFGARPDQPASYNTPRIQAWANSAPLKSVWTNSNDINLVNLPYVIPGGAGLILDDWYDCGPITLNPSTYIHGTGKDRSGLRLPSSYGVATLLTFEGTPYTAYVRRLILKDFGLMGASVNNTVGIQLTMCRDVHIDLYIARFGYNIKADHAITVELYGTYIDARQGGIDARNNSNHWTYHGINCSASHYGPNIRLNGPDSYDHNLIGVCMESAGVLVDTPADEGFSLIVGDDYAVQNVNVIGGYVEFSRHGCFKIGKQGTPSGNGRGQSRVAIMGGFWSDKSRGGTFIKNIGGMVTLDGTPFAEDFFDNTFWVEDAIHDDLSVRPAIFINQSTQDKTIFGPAKDSAVLGRGYARENNFLRSSGIQLGGQTVEYGRFEIAGTGVNKRQRLVGDLGYEINTTIKTLWQARPSLTAGVATVTFGSAYPTANYHVYLSNSANGNRLKSSSRTVNGFVVTAVDETGATATGDTGNFDYFILRQG